PLPDHPEPAVNWHKGFRGGAHARPKATPIASLARPGRNATGVTFLLDELASKRLEIFKQAAPRISRVGFLWNPDHPDNELPEAERTAVSLGVGLKPLAGRGPADFDAAFVAATEARVDALYIVSSRLTLQNVGRILNF